MRHETRQVFNLEVEGAHTFLVPERGRPVMRARRAALTDNPGGGI